MADLSAFPITRRWPAKNPDIIQLYSLPTPNGVKASIALEELELPYEPHLVDFGKNDQQTFSAPGETMVQFPSLSASSLAYVQGSGSRDLIVRIRRLAPSSGADRSSTTNMTASTSQRC